MVALVIALALFFDFTNGFHDTANAMATPIATGAIKPKTAVALAAVLNLVGAFLSTEVAKTVSGGIIREGSDGVQITPDIIFAGLMGAILWNMITWLKGLPSSSSHALFGGLIGAAIAGIGFHSMNFETLLQKVILPAVFAPLIAGIVAYICTRLAYALTSRHDPETGSKLTQKRGGFRTGQIFTSSLVALAHGTNDAQKTMGIITLVLISAGTQAPGLRPAALGHRRLRPGHRHRHLLRRLADHPHHGLRPHRSQARPGLRGRDQHRLRHPGLLAPGLRPLHHAGGLRLRHRLGHGTQGHHRALGHGGQDRPRLAVHPSRRRHRGRADGAARARPAWWAW